jgi:nucleotide-binding universal stress UspA family protein
LLRHCPSAVWLFSEDTGLKIRRVLVAVDPMAADDSHAEINDRLLKIASSIHQTEKCDLFVVHAWSLFGEQILRSRLTPSQIDELRAAERQEAEKSLSRLVSQYELPQASDNIFLKEGNPAAVIRELVKDKNIDLLMMGTIAHGGVAGFMMGNTAEAVFNRVDCSILAVKPKTFVSPIHPDDDRREQTKPATDERAQELQQH